MESTDDAYVGGNVTPISPHIIGFIAEVAVTDNQQVQAGQLLIRLDDRDMRAGADHAKAILEQRTAVLSTLRAQYTLQQSTIEQATADLNAKRAQADFAKIDAERYRILAAKDSGSQQQAHHPTGTAHAQGRGDRGCLVTGALTSNDLTTAAAPRRADRIDCARSPALDRSAVPSALLSAQCCDH
jgi:multidrug resistance efflux pump